MGLVPALPPTLQEQKARCGQGKPLLQARELVNRYNPGPDPGLSDPTARRPPTLLPEPLPGEEEAALSPLWGGLRVLCSPEAQSDLKWCI